MRRVVYLVMVVLVSAAFFAGCGPGGSFRVNAPPGRNEMGVGVRHVTDAYVFTDTGETVTPEEFYLRWLAAQVANGKIVQATGGRPVVTGD